MMPTNSAEPASGKSGDASCIHTLTHSGIAPNATPHASTMPVTTGAMSLSSGMVSNANISSKVTVASEPLSLRATNVDTAKFEKKPMMTKPSSTAVMVDVLKCAFCRNGAIYVYDEKCAPKISATINRLLRGNGRRTSVTRSAKRKAAADGSDGSSAICEISATLTSTAVAMNDMRHEARLAMKVPRGTPITVAQVT